MKSNIAIFTIIGVFFVIIGTIYGFWNNWTEWAGIPALYALGGMAFLISGYLWLTDRKFGLGPADDEDGEISQYSGTYGNFAPWSWWPLGLGFCCAILVTGLAIDWWIFFIGAGFGIYFLVGWVYEYSRGQHAH